MGNVGETTLDHDEAMDLIWVIDDDGHGLTDWEANFIDDLMTKGEDDPDWEPSEDEALKIREIFTERVTP